MDKLPKNPEITGENDPVARFLDSLSEPDESETQPSDLLWAMQQIQWLAAQVKNLQDNQLKMLEIIRVMKTKIEAVYNG